MHDAARPKPPPPRPPRPPPPPPPAMTLIDPARARRRWTVGAIESLPFVTIGNCCSAAELPDRFTFSGSGYCVATTIASAPLAGGDNPAAPAPSRVSWGHLQRRREFHQGVVNFAQPHDGIVSEGDKGTSARNVAAARWRGGRCRSRSGAGRAALLVSRKGNLVSCCRPRVTLPW
jgi:hypothetical protein